MDKDNNQKLLSVEIQKEFDVLNKDFQEKVFVKLYSAARTSGFLADISDRDWKTLCVLATFMDPNGDCYPSQDEIARALNISRQTANERISSLLNYRWQGKPVVVMVKHRREASTGKKGQRWDNNRYTILPLSNLVFGKIEPVSGHPDTGKTLDFARKKPMSANPDIGFQGNNKPVSAKPDIGKSLDFAEKKPVSAFPVSGYADTNKNKRSIVVVVKDQTQEKPHFSGLDEPQNKRECGLMGNEIQQLPGGENITPEVLSSINTSIGTELEPKFISKLLKDFNIDYITKKLTMLKDYCSRNHVPNLPGLIVKALKEDWKIMPAPAPVVKIKEQSNTGSKKKLIQNNIDPEVMKQMKEKALNHLGEGAEGFIEEDIKNIVEIFLNKSEEDAIKEIKKRYNISKLYMS